MGEQGDNLSRDQERRLEASFDELMEKDSRGEINTEDYVKEMFRLGARKRDLFAKPQEGQESFEDALIAVIESKDFVTAKIKGYSRPASYRSPTREQFQIEQMVAAVTEEKLADPLFSSRLALSQGAEKQRKTTASWNNLQKDIEGLEDHTKAIIVQFKLAGQAYGYVRGLAQDFYKTDTQLLVMDRRQYWRNVLIGNVEAVTSDDEKKKVPRSVGYTLGYINRLLSETETVIESKHPEDSEEAMSLWSVVNYFNAEGAQEEVRAMRPSIYKMLEEGKWDEARSTLVGMTYLTPLSFRERHYKYLGISKDESFQKYLQQLNTELQKIQGMTWQERYSQFEKKKLEAGLKTARTYFEQASEDNVRKGQELFGNYYLMKTNDPLDNRIKVIQVKEIGETEKEILLPDGQGSKIVRQKFPTLVFTTQIYERGGDGKYAHHRQQKTNIYLPGRVLDMIEGKDEMYELHSLDIKDFADFDPNKQ